MTKYDPKEIETKWQKEWEKNKLNVVDIKGAKKPFYNLMMFPYPSAEGLHVGNTYAFIASDVYGRFKRLQGYDVFEPIGLDGFGIHSENYSLKIGKHPMDNAKVTEERFYREQLAKIGNMYDWSRCVETYKPDYYRWTQWLFVKMFKAGLAYRAKAEVNWCPSCKTVLSDEQVIDSKCERCSTVVTKKELEQWFFRITKYADRLLEGHKNIDWSEKVKTAQKNWIGKKDGVLVNFGEIEIFTTRIDTILGATFVVLSPNHPLAGKIKTVTNPATKKEIPVFVDEYVLDSVGTGAIMAVPAYDERDMVFAKKHNLPVVTDFELVPDIKIGKKTSIYHLRDWLVSRQRYWGPPIPMINCPKCGWVPVPEKGLPVKLPFIKDYQPKGTGKGPLASHPEFYKTSCPECGGPAERETDVSDTFLDSAWYELRYPSVGISGTVKNGEELPWDEKLLSKWLPVNMYTGGPEHSVLHLMYFRFVSMALFDMGYLPFAEPCERFFAHGMIIKDGAKMSKSKGNVVNPDKYIAKFGADTLRLYLMFMGPVAGGGDFRDSGMEGISRWIDRVYRVILSSLSNSANFTVNQELNKLIKKAELDFESRHYNTTIAKMMEFVNLLTRDKLQMTNDQVKKFLLVLAPFAPHLTEELWHELGNKESIHLQGWPKADEGYLEPGDSVVAISINGKTKTTIKISSHEVKVLTEAEIVQTAKKDNKVAKLLEGREIKRTIYVIGKILNFVV